MKKKQKLALAAGLHLISGSKSTALCWLSYASKSLAHGRQIPAITSIVRDRSPR